MVWCSKSELEKLAYVNNQVFYQFASVFGLLISQFCQKNVPHAGSEFAKSCDKFNCIACRSAKGLSVSYAVNYGTCCATIC